MSVVDIKDLQDHAEDLVTRVQDDGESIEIAVDGRVVAHLVPPPPDTVSEDAQQVRDANNLETWRRLLRLGEEMDRTWPEGVSAVDAIREDRRQQQTQALQRPALNQHPSGAISNARTSDETPDTAAETGEVLDRLWSLGDEISKSWPQGVSAVDAIRDVRRDS